MWYPVCVLKAAQRACYHLNVTNDYDAFDLSVIYDAARDADIDVANAAIRTGAAYTFALANPMEEDGAKYATLYMKREGGEEANLSLSVAATNIPRNGDVFAHSLYVKENDAAAEIDPIASVQVE